MLVLNLYDAVMQELARLWDWQHRRAAQGLPLHATFEEEEVRLEIIWCHMLKGSNALGIFILTN